MATRKARIKQAASVLAVAVLLVTGWEVPAGAVTRTGAFNLFNVLGRRCVDADTNTIGLNGAKVQLWRCNAEPQQHWTFYTDGTIRTSYGGKCLDADTNTINRNGTKVQLWACNRALQQKWRFVPGITPGTRRVVSRYSGRCLDADTNTIRRDGTVVQLWDCNGQPQQDFRISYP